MQDNHLHIIRLKQQFKQGGGPSGDAEKKKKEAEEAAKNARKAAGDTFGKVIDKIINLTSVSDALATTNISVSTGIQKLIAVQQQYSTTLTTAADDATKLEQRNHSLQKSFQLNIEAAGNFGFELEEQASKLNFSRENVEKYVTGLNGLTAGFIAAEGRGGYLNESLIKQQRYLTDIIGVSNEAAEAILEMNAGYASRNVGKDEEVTADMLEQQLVNRANEAKAIEKITGLKGVQRTIDEQIATAGSETALQYGRYPKQLSIAIMKGKALGLTMDQLARTGDTLLNIESSVGDELEYQLLSGKRLVDTQGNSLTNMYRQATLQGDMNKQANIMKTIMDTQGDALETNVLARKKLAATLGVEESTMAKMVQKRKLLKSLGAEKLFDLTGDKLEEQLKGLKVGREDIAKIMEQDDTRTTQEKQTELLARMYTDGIIANIKSTKQAAGTLAKGTSDDIIAATNKLTPLFTNINKFSETSAESIGAIKQYTESLGSFKTTTQTFLNNLPKVNADAVKGGVLAGISSGLEKALTGKDGVLGKLGDLLKFATGGKMANMTVKTTSMTVTETSDDDDAIMMNDGFVRFNPRDKFTRVNDGMTVAGTNVGGIDRFAAQMEKRDSRFEQTMTRVLSNMAAQMKQSIESANLKVNVDKTFSGNNMNRGRYA